MNGPHTSIVLTILILFLITCFISPKPTTSQLISQSDDGPKVMDKNLKIDSISKRELKFPTSMAFLGSNDILVLEKNNGTVKRIVNGVLQVQPLLDVNVANKDERGMLGIAIDPNIINLSKGNRTLQKSYNLPVFLFYTEAVSKDGDDVTEGKEPLGNRLYKYELVNNKLINPKLLLELPTSPTGIHNGGKIVIGPDGNIYLTIGDLGIFDTTQKPSKVQNFKTGEPPNRSGGILRITQDGKAVDGGILGPEDPLNLYFAYGIRNSFGMDFDPITGKLWDTENGPFNGDEINLVEPGFNSGWGKVQGIWKIRNQSTTHLFHNTSMLVDFNSKGKYSTPEFVWNTTVGATDLKFLNSDKLGKIYENDMLVGDFHRGIVYRFHLSDNRSQLLLEKPLVDRLANSQDELKDISFGNGFGGITDLEVGPDGYLYILALDFGGRNCDPNLPDEPCVSYNGINTGTIFRIVPAK
jgi:glucose/arabinose dehydrogenase